MHTLGWGWLGLTGTGYVMRRTQKYAHKRERARARVRSRASRTNVLYFEGQLHSSR